MRDVLFRGKVVDTQKIVGGQWIEGSLIYIVNDKETVCKITDTCLSKADGMMVAYDVDPETLGQYTGLRDRNGRKIFEGDIVKGKDDTGYIKFGYARFLICWKKSAELKNVDLDVWHSDVEVIGNIFDRVEAKMTLVMTVEVDFKGSGTDPEKIKTELGTFARELLILGGNELELGIDVEEVKSEGVTWTRQ